MEAKVLLQGMTSQIIYFIAIIIINQLINFYVSVRGLIYNYGFNNIFTDKCMSLFSEYQLTFV